MLTEYFTGVSIKRLSAVESNPEVSNQHEFNGAKPIVDLLGIPEEKIRIQCQWLYFGDEEEDLLTDSAQLTWYDSRFDHPDRTEYRLYYQSNEVINAASEGDLLLVCLKNNGQILVIICKEGSTYESQLLWLFGLSEKGADHKFTTHTTEIEREVGFAERRILEVIGLEVEIEEDQWLDEIISQFGDSFPTTRIFSAFARSTLTDIDSRDNPDEAIFQWINQEEMLFRTFEKHLVGNRIKEGFDDVDTFVQFSLGLHNRRKSRMGHALENHLEQIFIDFEIPYSRGKITENKSKPDFLFPSLQAYKDASYPAEGLYMLGAKSTCKDRWRQVLSEATRIQKKHLFTLEPGISTNQTDEMDSKGLLLVLPSEIHKTYNSAQQNWLMNLDQFLALVRARR